MKYNTNDEKIKYKIRKENKEVRRKIRIVRKILNAKNKNGANALIMASFLGHTEIAEVLIKAKADVNIKGGDGDTALIWASKNGHTDIVKLLRAEGARE